MVKGGFKVLINGKVRRVNSFAVDFDKGIFTPVTANLSLPQKAEEFDRKTFAVMAVTEEDKPE